MNVANFRSVTLGLLLGFLAVWLTVDLVTQTRGLRIASWDDHAVSSSITDARAEEELLLLDFQIGRPYAAAKLAFTQSLLSVPGDTLHAALRVSLVVLTALAASWFVWEWRRSAALAAFTGIVAAGLLQVSVSYQPLLSQPWLWPGWMGVWCMAALAVRPDSAKNRAALALAFGVSILVHESNVLFLPWMVALRFVHEPTHSLRRVLRAFVPAAAVLAAYVAVALLLRTEHAITYPGGLVSVNVSKFLHAVGVYSLGSLPGLEIWRAPWAGPKSPLWLTPQASYERLMQWADLVVVIGAVLVGIATWLVLSRSHTDAASAPSSPRQSSGSRTFVLLVASAFLPNVMMAITEKYQAWSYQRMWPYYYSSMSYLVWVVILVTGAAAFMGRLKRPSTRVAAGVAVALLFGLIAFGSLAIRREAASSLRSHPLFHLRDYPTARDR